MDTDALCDPPRIFPLDRSSPPLLIRKRERVAPTSFLFSAKSLEIRGNFRETNRFPGNELVSSLLSIPRVKFKFYAQAFWGRGWNGLDFTTHRFPVPMPRGWTRASHDTLACFDRYTVHWLGAVKKNGLSERGACGGRGEGGRKEPFARGTGSKRFFDTTESRSRVKQKFVMYRPRPADISRIASYFRFLSH